MYRDAHDLFNLHIIRTCVLRSELNFNDNWLYAPRELALGAPDSDFAPATLPHTNINLPHHNFDNAEYQFISTYRKRFTLPEPLDGRRLFIDFDGAMLVSTVYLNGHKLGVNAGGYTPFSFDLTDHIREGENVLAVHLDSRELPDVPPFGYVVDYLTFGGIYRDVRLRYVEPITIDKVFVTTQGDGVSRSQARVAVFYRNTGKAATQVHISASYSPNPTTTLEGSQPITIPAGTSDVLELSFAETEVEYWSPEHPALYEMTVTIGAKIPNTNAIIPYDQQQVHFGFREFAFRDDGFYLNGRKIQLRGLNRHQTYPYIGAAAPARLQRQDADILKYELGCNIVRTSHYPQSPHFLDRCDEIGLLVFEEIPGWQHIGDEDWQALSLRDVTAMIERDRNHPSIIIWGVRVNESLDDEAFYTRTNTLARQLDPTRPTTGVRYFQDSSFLEDVFGFNDFSNSIETPVNTPHIVTEYNGHMFPTKTFDSEERKVEHARRHAHVQDRAHGQPNVTGAIGWCAFDYNTHKEFGSGDRICYHGVMDIFRLPKWAAAVYASQVPPSERIVLQAATHWTMGDRSEGGNDPILVFSNVEEIDVWYGDEHLGRFTPDHETYPHLPHPPFTVTGLQMMMMWGRAFGALRIVGIINGEQVAEQRISSDGVPRQLVAIADFTELQADGADMTPVKVRITDEYGVTLPYAQQAVTFTVDGPGELVGENPLVLPGGQAAVYLKATHEPGTVTVTAHTLRLNPVTVHIQTKGVT
jgi:beta-galactosidase